MDASGALLAGQLRQCHPGLSCGTLTRPWLGFMLARIRAVFKQLREFSPAKILAPVPLLPCGKYSSRGLSRYHLGAYFQQTALQSLTLE